MSSADPAPPAQTRDRDRSGRPRNNRPRDGLGRPLPRGATGVPRDTEGVEGGVRTPEQTIRVAQQLLDDRMPFHAHEVFEDAWKAASPSERELWRGLAQLAVGLTHALRGNPRGADALLRRGAGNIAAFAPAAPYGLDVGGLLEWAQSAAAAVQGGAPVPAMPRLRGRAVE